MKKVFIQFFTLIALFISVHCHAQLNNFTLNVTPAPQTCLGNGSLTFSVSGTVTGAAMGYEVYLLPNTATPVATVTANLAQNLVAGSYLVVATQTSGALSNTATANAVIINQVVPLAYTLQITNVHCAAQQGSITVITTTGTPVSYEIMSGPVTYPLQSSNVFSNLPVGQYQVRVYDNCGEAVVVNVQIVQTPSTFSVNVDDDYFNMITCTTVKVRQYVYANTTGGEVAWPLTFLYTVYPPGGGAAQIVTNTLAAGTGDLTDIFTELPFYYDELYHYNLKVTDACGHVVNANNNTIDLSMAWHALTTFNPCLPDVLKIVPDELIKFPLTVTFISSPTGFNPVLYNASHPVFNDSDIIYTQSGATIPLGYYEIMVTDACGHSKTTTYHITANDFPPITGQIGSGCAGGTIKIYMPGKLATAVFMTAAPAAYTETLPKDLMSYAVGGDFEIGGLPAGQYTFSVTDECGYSFILQQTVVITPVALTIDNKPGCEPGYGSIGIDPDSDNFESIIITQAPIGFAETLPYDASVNITSDSGTFYMNSLPAGAYTYTFTTQNCDVPETRVFNIIGYIETSNVVQVIPLCGSFNLYLKNTSNSWQSLQSYWLQKYNEETGTWGHPLTGNPYFEGADPNTGNSIQLNNNSTNLNLAYTGTFRVLKDFYHHDNHAAWLVTCKRVLGEFTYDGAPQITDAYSFPCPNGFADIAIIATGVAPLTYSITLKNGDPFIINNGVSGFFTSLEPAIYNFQVTDVCGNIRNIVYDISKLSTIAISASGFCAGQSGTLNLPDFPFLSYQWSRQDAPQNILSTSHNLTIPSFNPATDAGVYTVTITSLNPGSCANQVLQYTILPTSIPNAGGDAAITLCKNIPVINLEDYLGTPHDSGGAWQSLTPGAEVVGNSLSISLLAAGVYQFKYTISACGIADESMLTLTLMDAPIATIIAPVTQFCEGSTIQLTAQTVTNASYQWSGPQGIIGETQIILINNVTVTNSGNYTLTVTANGCSSPVATIAVLVKALPDFTIEGDALLCTGKTDLLSVTPLNFDIADAVYSWFYNGILQPATDASVEVTETGLYKAIVSLGSCTTEKQFTVSQNSNAFDVLLEAGCVEDHFIISISNTDAIGQTQQIEWEGPNGYEHTGNDTSIDITDLAIGQYSVLVTTINGCSATAALPVTNTACTIPKGISPNGDDWNNEFDLTNLEVKHIEIFNRYGLEVYKKDNYLNEWHGQSDKGDLPTGTYFYVVTLSAGKQKTGWVYLQREN